MKGETTMKTVNDFLTNDCFVIKNANGNVLGLQINDFGETHLTDKYGHRPVVGCRMESGTDIWGETSIAPDDTTLVLYI
jgi:hypothetical protein